MKISVVKYAVLTGVVVSLLATTDDFSAQANSCDPLKKAMGRHCPSDLQLTLLPKTHIELFGDKRGVEGADNWPLTWSITGEQVTVWGDGHGPNVNGSVREANVSLGVARIRGPYATRNPVQFRTMLRGASRRNCLKKTRYPTNLRSFDGNGICGKSYGVLALQTAKRTERLLMWVSPGSGGAGYQSNTLYQSTGTNQFKALFTVNRDKTNGNNNQTKVGGLISPAFLQAGPGYTRTGQKNDEFIYIYWIYHDPKPGSAAVNVGLHIHGGIRTGKGRWRTGKIYLSRVRRKDYANATRYQFYNGRGFSRFVDIRTAPVPRIAKPVFENTKGVGWTVSVTYLPNLDGFAKDEGRYLLITEYNKTFKGQFGVYESTSPTGPWREVHRFNNLSNCLAKDTGANGFYMNVSTRWYAVQAARNRTANLPLTFTGVGNDDSFNSVMARLQKRQPRRPGRRLYVPCR